MMINNRMRLIELEEGRLRVPVHPRGGTATEIEVRDGAYVPALIAFARRSSGALRGLIVGEELFTWPAYDCNHDTMVRALRSQGMMGQDDGGITIELSTTARWLNPGQIYIESSLGQFTDRGLIGNPVLRHLIEDTRTWFDSIYYGHGPDWAAAMTAGKKSRESHIDWEALHADDPLGG